jgi:hypothetical protein
MIARRAMGRIFSGDKTSGLKKEELADVKSIATLGSDPAEIARALAPLSPLELKHLARNVLWERAGEAIDLLRDCATCRELLSEGGYDPVELLETLRDSIGQPDAQMDIDESGLGGSQRGQGLETRIRFGPLEFLTGTSLAGMTVRESQLQVILHELAHAAGDVIPPDGGNPQESMRNQHRITRACLPETYERIDSQQSVVSSQ